MKILQRKKIEYKILREIRVKLQTSFEDECDWLNLKKFYIDGIKIYISYKRTHRLQPLNVTATKLRVTREGNRVLRGGRNRGIILRYERGATKEREETKGRDVKARDGAYIRRVSLEMKRRGDMMWPTQ